MEVKINIFYLDHDPILAARYHGDKHLVKMTVETAQMLSTAHHVHSGALQGLYKPTHRNHPMTVWVRKTRSNYEWTYQFFQAMCDEFTFRRDKIHATSRLLEPLLIPPTGISKGAITDVPLCMPEEFHLSCPVESYRKYYHSKWQEGIVSYNWGRPIPDWL